MEPVTENVEKIAVAALLYKNRVAEFETPRVSPPDQINWLPPLIWMTGPAERGVVRSSRC